MQGKNSTRSKAPNDGDGTQDVRRKQDANWYGQSQEPQEEFIAGDGQAHTGDSRDALQPLTPERAAKRDTKRPSDIDNRH